ncbi:MAG: hypothetical protein J5825_02195, partial [Lachnospiraceae bacterium]|nr:hypothetical protein [Lachnospiraceae bacterium]
PDVEGTLKTSFGSYLYYEMLPVTFYVLSAAVFCEIAKLLGFQMRRRRLLGYAALTVPLALYSQFIFCQYDIFTVFFVLLGIYFYLKGDLLKFALLFGFAITFKYFALAIFVPMLLLKEKNPLKILLYLILAAVIPVAEVALCWHEQAFLDHVLGFTAIRYVMGDFLKLVGGSGKREVLLSVGPLFQHFLSIGGSRASEAVSAGNSLVQSASVLGASSASGISLAGAAGSSASFLQVLRALPYNLIIAAGLCIGAYFTRVKNRLEEAKWIAFYGSAMCFAVFGFMFWHPQWLLFVLPFYTLSFFLQKKPGRFVFCELILMLVFCMYVVNKWMGDLDQTMMEKGLLGALVAGQTGTETMMRDIYGYYSVTVLKFAVSVMMMVMGLLSFPKFLIGEIGEEPPHLLGWIRFRWSAGLLIYLWPALTCLLLAFIPPYCTFSSMVLSGHLPGITPESWLSEVFTVKTDDARYLEFYAYDYDRENTGELIAVVRDLETGEELGEQHYDVSTFANRGWQRVDLKDMGLVAGGKYRVDFIAPEGTPDNSVTIYHSQVLSREKKLYYGLYNNEPLGSDLCIKILEGSKPEEEEKK